MKAALVVFGAIIAFHPQLCLLSLPSFAAPKLRADTPLKWTCRLEYYILKPYIYICAPAKQCDLECLFHWGMILAFLQNKKQVINTYYQSTVNMKVKLYGFRHVGIAARRGLLELFAPSLLGARPYPMPRRRSPYLYPTQRPTWFTPIPPRSLVIIPAVPCEAAAHKLWAAGQAQSP